MGANVRVMVQSVKDLEQVRTSRQVQVGATAWLEQAKVRRFNDVIVYGTLEFRHREADVMGHPTVMDEVRR